MGHRNTQDRLLKTNVLTGNPGKSRKLFGLAFPCMIVAGVALVAYLAFFSNAAPVASTPTATRKARSLDALLAMAPDQLAQVDIAEMNLLCATGLPGAENLDIDKCLAKLDEWAARVKFETARHLYRAHDPRWAEHYHNSENYLRAEFLLQVLQEDLGVHYNMDRVKNIDFGKSKDLFIHGLVDDTNGGTCASMPVAYVAVGRRLGYPLKLVQTKAHVFVRWDDGKERFNIEGAGNGFSSNPDDYYKSWPMKSTDAEVKANRYLISLSPAEELGDFMASRRHCLLENGKDKEAFAAYAQAHRLAPLDPAYHAWMREAEARFNPHAFREPPLVYHPVDPLEGYNRINTINRANMERIQPAMPPVFQGAPGLHMNLPQAPGPGQRR